MTIHTIEDISTRYLKLAWRTGATPQQIADQLAAKQTKNESRTWPDWTTADPDKPIEHVRWSLGVFKNAKEEEPAPWGET